MPFCFRWLGLRQHSAVLGLTAPAPSLSDQVSLPFGGAGGVARLGSSLFTGAALVHLPVLGDSAQRMALEVSKSR
eukprot:6213990-Pleurochrysis_carterae.AAC.1